MNICAMCNNIVSFKDEECSKCGSRNIIEV